MTGINLIHCSYHKCLTVYYSRVMRSVCNRCLRWRGRYRHFNSDLETFYRQFSTYRVASINNRALDLTRLGNFRVSRFIRDPRDLVVSGYFYHRRRAEPWVTLPAPTTQAWYFANGVVPAALQGRRSSFAEYLSSVSEEEGLLAELEFRQAHFESMRRWPVDHPQVVTYRYEDIVGQETQVFRALFDFYGFSQVEGALGGWFVRRYALRRQTRDEHVRNPLPGQWRKHFTARVKQVFDAQYGGLIKELGYPAD